MAKFFTLVFSISFLIGKAQITITQNDLPSVGTLIGLVEDSLPANGIEGSSGANQSWDLTAIQNLDSTGADFQTPLAVTGGGNFPNSNIAVPDSGNTGGTFFYSSPSTFDLVGFYGDFGFGPMAVKFNPVETWLTLPSTYQTTFSGTSKYQIAVPYSSPPIDSVKVVSTNSYNSIIDGWGTVSTPDFSNIACLRQKITAIKVDSTFVHYFNTWVAAGTPTYDTTITYRWWGNAAKMYIAEVVTDQNGVAFSASYLINTAPFCTISATATSTDETGYGFNDGTATAAASGGITPYFYNWSNGASSASVTGLAPGTYIVTVTDAINCAVYDTIIVDSYVCSFAIATSSTDENSYNGDNGTATVTVSGGNTPYAYAWSNGGTTSSVSGLAPGNYSVSVTDNNGCVATDSVIINAYVCTFSVSVSATDESAQGASDGTVSATVTGGTSPIIYSWSNGATTASVSGLAPGIYQVAATDASNCPASGSAIVNGGGCTLAVDSLVVVDNNCSGDSSGSATVYVSGGTTPYSYNWSNGTSPGESISGLAAGSYSVTVSDAGTCFVSSTDSVGEPAPLTVAVSGTDVTCYGSCDGNVLASASGGSSPYTYSWSSGWADCCPLPFCAGTYAVTVTDNNGCVASGSKTIAAPDSISLTFGSTNANCGSDGTATVSASGGSGSFSYLWNDANAQTTAIATGLGLGTYSVTVTDSSGCTTSGSVTITSTGGMQVFATGADVSCNGGNDGVASASVSGGNTPYTYSWNDTNSQTTATAIGLIAGNYFVMVTDSNGCVGSATVTVSEPPALLVSPFETNPPLCGFNNGEAGLYVTGGTSPYTYLWSDGQTTANASGLAPGAYGLTVTDANNCTGNASVSISQSSAISIIMSSSADSGSTNGTATVYASGGTSPYTYSWSNGASSATITGLASGDYDVTVTDINGCVAADSVFVDLWVSLSQISNLKSQISIYPNPALNRLLINFKSPESGKVNINVMNAAGQKYLMHYLEFPQGNSAIPIEIRGLPPGAYYLKIIINDQEPEYLRFIKMK